MELKDLDLNKLHVFTTVARSRTMTEAARALGRTTSAVSQSVAALERSLGFPLFRRIGARRLLTEEAQALNDGLVRYESQLGALFREVTRRPRDGLAGRVRLGLFPGYPAARIGPLLADGLRAHPGLELRLRFLAHAELADALARGGLDLALSLTPLDRHQPALRSRRLFDEELVLVSASPGGRGEAPLAIRRDALAELPVIEYFEAPSLFGRWARHHFGAAPRRPRVRAYAATLEYVLELVRRRAGFAVVPRAVVEAELRSRALLAHRAHRSRARGELKDSVWLNLPRAVAAEGSAAARFEELVSSPWHR